MALPGSTTFTDIVFEKIGKSSNHYINTVLINLQLLKLFKFMKNKAIRLIVGVMKLSIYVFIVQVAALNFMLAEESNGQQSRSVRETFISLNLSNASIKEAFKHLESVSDFRFNYDKADINTKRKIDLSYSNTSIADILLNISKEYHLGFKQLNNTIQVDKLGHMSPDAVIEVVMSDVNISGKVTDENGEGLPGASVVVKGTAIGTTTDLDGKYQISVLEESTLVISFVGYQASEILVGNQSVIDIQLKIDAAELDEIVVIGYGTQKKSDLTGSIVNVDPGKTKDMQNHNILQSLKGRVAGLSVGTPDRPGEEPSFQVRGRNSLSASNSPLIVVDGIIYYGSLNNINASDIQSVDVLKDASAAAVYGSRSSNGVIIVTTKKGDAGKPKFNFNASYGMSDDVKKIPVLGPEGYIQKVLDDRIARGQEANPANINNYLTLTESNNLTAGKTVDWYDELINPSATKNYSLGVSGSSENTDYFISGSYNKTGGIVKNDDFERITARVNLSNQITDWFTLSVKSSFSNLDYSGVEVPYRWGLSPYSNYYDDGISGELEQFPMEDTYFQHPFLNLLIDDHDVRTDLWGVLSSQIDIPFIDGLKWTMNYSLNSRRRNEFRFTDNRLSSAATTNGNGYKRIHDDSSWTFDNILNYNQVFGGVHSVGATFLVSREYQKSEYTSASATQFFNQNLGYNSLGVGGTSSVTSDFGDQNQQAVMGRVNYMFKDKYGITATIRRDGFSGFAQGNKYATFLSGALAWTISNEAFMENVSWLNRLKLKLSYGENGNQAIGRYQTLAAMSSRNMVFGDGGGTTTGVYVSRMANNQLGWESTKVTNFGIEFGILDNMLTGGIDIYNSNTTDLLVDRNLPSHTGFTSVKTNLGQINNKGIEIALNGNPIRSDVFSWNVGLVFDLNRNKIVSLFGDDNDGDGKEDDVLANSWFIGEPLGVQYGYAVDGIHQTSETDLPSGYQAGDFRIVDYDGDGELTTDDRHILGYSIPNFTFSISNSLSYKNWSLYAMVNSIQGGGNYYMSNNILLHNPNASFDGWSQRFSLPQIDYWTPTNPSNTVARINYNAPRSHPFLEDRSFVRIQDITLSYTFDIAVLDKLKVNSLRLYASVKNLHTFTSWSGYDPENGTSVNDLPLMRTVTFGVDLSF